MDCRDGTASIRGAAEPQSNHEISLHGRQLRSGDLHELHGKSERRHAPLRTVGGRVVELIEPFLPLARLIHEAAKPIPRCPGRPG
jgi:hypothetical protein